MNIVSVTEYTLQIVKIVKFMSYIFYYNLKNPSHVAMQGPHHLSLTSGEHGPRMRENEKSC